MKRFLLAGGIAATTFIWQVEAALAVSESEKQPLNLPLEQVEQQAGGGSGNSAGGGLMRTFIGLLIVVAIIYGLYWVLRQVKKAREEQASGSGLHSLATLPLGPNRSLHMIRAGREIVLVGVAEHGVSPIRSYTEEEAFEAGLIGDPADDDTSASGGGPGGPNGTILTGRRGASAAGFASPGQAIGTALGRLRQRTVRK